VPKSAKPLLISLISMGKIIFSISLDKELFQKLEDQRGLIPRSIFLEHLLKKLIEEQKIKGNN